MTRTRKLVAAAAFAGAVLGVGLLGPSGEPSRHPNDQVQFERLQVSGGRGWIDTIPAGSSEADAIPTPPTVDGGVPVYADDTGFEVVGTMTPSGFVPLGDPIPESPVTTWQG